MPPLPPQPVQPTVVKNSDDRIDVICRGLMLPPAQAMVVTKSETDSASNPAARSNKSKPKVWSFSLSIGRDKPFLIKGTISESADEPPDAAAQ